MVNATDSRAKLVAVPDVSAGRARQVVLPGARVCCVCVCGWGGGGVRGACVLCVSACVCVSVCVRGCVRAFRRACVRVPCMRACACVCVGQRRLSQHEELKAIPPSASACTWVVGHHSEGDGYLSIMSIAT